MKNTKVFASILTLSVAWAIVTLGWKGGIDVPVADTTTPPPILKLLSAKATITHATANCHGSIYSPFSGVISCGVDCDFLTGAPGPPVSFTTGPLFSDSYEVDAALNIDPATLSSFPNQSIFIGLIAGTCASFNPSAGIGSFPFLNTTDQAIQNIIPGNNIKFQTTLDSVHATYEGEAPGISASLTRFFSFSHVHLDMSIPQSKAFPKYYEPPSPPPARLHIRANGAFCSLTGPMAFAISLVDSSNFSSGGNACIDIPAPTFKTVDVSQSFCLLETEFGCSQP